MRLEKLIIKQGAEKFNIEIPIKEGNWPFIVVYCEGIAKKTYLPGHGETKIITHQGTVKRVKVEEGENF
ncbi:XtrA/YqaO family protein [Paraliobacillus zengyii]|uniref:XtrA/YqaO family protein n=1 Tax=Paraliobacillus zengyii TaxID=2213194 RepID=UPI000DD4CDCC|nr:XtrA/YqaO family protein [Paraliobacillus zengyii]